MINFTQLASKNILYLEYSVWRRFKDFIRGAQKEAVTTRAFVLETNVNAERVIHRHVAYCKKKGHM